MDTIAILSKDTMTYNITKGNSGQFHKAWVCYPLRKNVDGGLQSFLAGDISLVYFYRNTGKEFDKRVPIPLSLSENEKEHWRWSNWDLSPFSFTPIFPTSFRMGRGLTAWIG
jgi:hypothetical protein